MHALRESIKIVMGIDANVLTPTLLSSLDTYLGKYQLLRARGFSHLKPCCSQVTRIHLTLAVYQRLGYLGCGGTHRCQGSTFNVDRFPTLIPTYPHNILFIRMLMHMALANL